MIPLASPTLFLYGPPATGKSTCARNLAVALGKTAIDLDTLVEQRVGMTIPEYVAKAGGEAFRDAETETLRALCNERPDAVVALGGGTLLRPQNRHRLYRHAARGTRQARRAQGRKPSLLERRRGPAQDAGRTSGALRLLPPAREPDG